MSASNFSALDYAALLEVFLAESNEAVAAMEEALLALEEHVDDASHVQTLFRLTHTLKGNAASLGVHPRKDGLRVNLVLARRLEGDRMVKSEQVSKSRFHNELDLAAGLPIDPELAEWLREAYALQG